MLSTSQGRWISEPTTSRGCSGITERSKYMQCCNTLRNFPLLSQEPMRRSTVILLVPVHVGRPMDMWAVQLFLACPWPFQRKRRTLMKWPQPIIGFYPMTDDALVQRLLQMETTVKGLSSEIQRMKEMIDQDTRHKNSEKLLHLKIRSRQNKFSILKLNCKRARNTAATSWSQSWSREHGQ